MDVQLIEETLEECMAIGPLPTSPFCVLSFLSQPLLFLLAGAGGETLREVIPSTMGEPLMYEHFQTVLNLCEQYGVKLNLTTNGTFPKKGPVWWAHQLLPVSSDIKISWSGATKLIMEEVMRGSNWEKRVADLDKFLEAIS
jgi:wyosine [tRNA(Phe)-imidazoG37] synthetase (radical SAM superfamily)